MISLTLYVIGMDLGKCSLLAMSSFGELTIHFISLSYQTVRLDEPDFFLD